MANPNNKAKAFILSVILLGTTFFLFTPSSGSNGCMSPLPGIVAWWPGDGNATDIIGGNDGTLHDGATYSAGVVGQAFIFDGEDDRISVPDSGDLNLTKSLTIEAWIYVYSFPPSGTDYFILFRGADGDDVDPYFLSITEDFGIGSLSFQIGNTVGNTDSRSTMSSDIPKGSWLHVAVTLDDSTGTRRMFLNGTLKYEPVSKTTIRPGGELDPAQNPGVGIGNVGGYPGTTTNAPFHGIIDELAVYNRALTEEEIKSIFDAGAEGKCKYQQPTFEPVPIINEPANGTSFDTSEVITFNGSDSYDTDGNIVSYDWDFGDSSMGSGITVDHSFTSPGVYDVCLTVTDDLSADATTCNEYLIGAFAITIDTSPTGLEVLVDGTGRTAPYSFVCDTASTFDINVTTPQVDDKERFVFGTWSDGGSQGHSILCDSPKNILANFTTEYDITVATNPPNRVFYADDTKYNVNTNFWWEDGSTHWLNVTEIQYVQPKTWYQFTDWSDGKTDPNRTFTVVSWRYIGANFDKYHEVTISTDPPGFDFEVDGVTYSSSATLVWPHRTKHELNTTDPPPNVTDERWAFSSWSTGAGVPRNHTFTVFIPSNLVVSFELQYLVTIEASHPGLNITYTCGSEIGYLGSPGEFWCDTESVVAVTALSQQFGLNFSHWKIENSSYSEVTAPSYSFHLSEPTTFTAVYEGTLNIPYPPSVSVVLPKDNAELVGTVQINGTATPNSMVEIRVDNGTAIKIPVSDSGEWTYQLNTKFMANGNHTIQIMAFNLSGESDTTTVNVVVNNPLSSRDDPAGEFPWWIIVLAVIFLIVLLLVLFRRKSRGGEQREYYQQPPPPRYQPPPPIGQPQVPTEPGPPPPETPGPPSPRNTPPPPP